MNALQYVTCYPYRLSCHYEVLVDVHPEHILSTPFVRLHPDGLLMISEGYQWDGPSGPAIATESFMRGSFVHDALYTLMQRKLLDANQWRRAVDGELYRLCIEDGMWPIRAAWVYWAVRLFGKGHLS